MRNFSSQGRDAAKVLNRISANDVDVEPGRIVYTQWCNERGGIEADLTVTRLAEDKFMVVTGCAPQTRDFAWLKRHTPDDAHCIATDITSGLPMFAVMGPKSRALLQKLSGADLSNAAFPFGHSQRDRDRLCARAGEPHHLCRRARLGALRADRIRRACLRHDLREAGAEFGLTLAGMHTMNNAASRRPIGIGVMTCRTRRRRSRPGLGFAVAWDKNGGFIGREALIRQRDRNVQPKRMVCLALADASARPRR